MRHFTRGPKPPFSCDLHVLGTPPAFILSQDQTLQLFPMLTSPNFRQARYASFKTQLLTHYLVFNEQAFLVTVKLSLLHSLLAPVKNFFRTINEQPIEDSTRVVTKAGL